MERIEIEEIFSALGAVTIRPMFGGKVICHEGRIVAVDFQGDILLKADAVTESIFEAAGAIRWAYEGKAHAAALRSAKPSKRK
jgi:DNA transformation protein